MSNSKNDVNGYKKYAPKEMTKKNVISFVAYLCDTRTYYVYVMSVSLMCLATGVSSLLTKLLTVD